MPEKEEKGDAEKRRPVNKKRQRIKTCFEVVAVATIVEDAEVVGKEM